MANDLFTFAWPRPDNGFRWVDAELGSKQLQRALIEQSEPGVATRRPYDPLTQHPTLFRKFAETPPTEESILAFANRWGGLGIWESVTAPAPLVGRQAEPFSFWRYSISEMRQAVWIWDTLTSETDEERLALRHRVRWERGEAGHTAIVFDSHRGLRPGRTVGDDGFNRVVEIIATDQFGGGGMSQFLEGELAMPARALLIRWINRNLQGRASPRLFPDEWTQPQKERRFPLLASLRLVPSNLYACLWLQLGQVMSTNREQRKCRGCGEWFDVKAKGKRSDRTCCSDTCRKRVYRVRQDRARELFAQGQKVKEIAQEIGADVKIVKKWVANKKG
jgi:hypothetical protein